MFEFVTCVSPSYDPKQLTGPEISGLKHRLTTVINSHGLRLNALRWNNVYAEIELFFCYSAKHPELPMSYLLKPGV